MNKKIIYTFTLFSLIAMWGAFAFTAPVNAGPAAQETIIVPTVAFTIVPPDVNITAVVPVTGEDETATMNVMTLLFYGFLGLLAVVLLVALFASANRTTYIRREGPPPPPDNL
jgi:hypothetical protein